MSDDPLCPNCGNPLRRYGHYRQGQWVNIINCRNGALSCIQYKEVVAWLGRGEQYSKLAKAYGVTTTAIYKIAKRLQDAHDQP